MNKKKNDSEMSFSDYQQEKLKSYFQSDAADNSSTDEDKFLVESVEELSPAGILLDAILASVLTVALSFVAMPCLFLFMLPAFLAATEMSFSLAVVVIAWNTIVTGAVTVWRFKLHKGKPITQRALSFCIIVFMVNSLFLFSVAG